MNAIQRWYFWNGLPAKCEDDRADIYHQLKDTGLFDPPLWCKAKDVAELERVMAESQGEAPGNVRGYAKTDRIPAGVP